MSVCRYAKLISSAELHACRTANFFRRIVRLYDNLVLCNLINKLVRQIVLYNLIDKCGVSKYGIRYAECAPKVVHAGIARRAIPNTYNTIWLLWENNLFSSKNNLLWEFVEWKCQQNDNIYFVIIDLFRSVEMNDFSSLRYATAKCRLPVLCDRPVM